MRCSPYAGESQSLNGPLTIIAFERSKHIGPANTLLPNCYSRFPGLWRCDSLSPRPRKMYYFAFAGLLDLINYTVLRFRVIQHQPSPPPFSVDHFLHLPHQQPLPGFKLQCRTIHVSICPLVYNYRLNIDAYIRIDKTWPFILGFSKLRNSILWYTQHCRERPLVLLWHFPQSYEQDMEKDGIKF